jgi:predicted DNA-binding protein with PD1-like motif
MVAKIYSLKAGARVPDDIVAIARKEKIATAGVEAIGGFEELRLAYFNHEAKRYEEHDYREFLEVTGLLGNITQMEGRPFLHVHGTFGRRDLSGLAGHVMAAKVFPLLEVVVTPTKNRAVRKFDDGLGLNVIYKA